MNMLSTLELHEANASSVGEDPSKPNFDFGHGKVCVLWRI